MESNLSEPRATSKQVLDYDGLTSFLAKLKDNFFIGDDLGKPNPNGNTLYVFVNPKE